MHKKEKILAVMVYEPPWQYYVKYKRFLSELNHPFKKKIDFYIDDSLTFNPDVFRGYGAVVFFYHDPLKQLYPDVYKYAKKIENYCLLNEIAFINRPDALSLSSKSDQLRLMRTNGFNVANAFPFKKWDEIFENDTLRYPIFIRYNAGHDSLAEGFSQIFYSKDELRNSKELKEKKWKESEYLKGKVAVEWIDTKSVDNLYYKYRVFVFGSTVLRGPVQVSSHWCVHANNTIKSKNDNQDQVGTCVYGKEKVFFSSINRALGLDFSAVDYSYTKDGEIVIWEANPHPSLGTWAEAEKFKTIFVNRLSKYYYRLMS